MGDGEKEVGNGRKEDEVKDGSKKSTNGDCAKQDGSEQKTQKSIGDGNSMEIDTSRKESGDESSKSKESVCEEKDKSMIVKCPGSNCPFSHDLKAYLDSKPEDLGKNCINFDTFGFCHYGVTCRFASSHVKNGFNVKDEVKMQKMQHQKVPLNAINKEVWYSHCFFLYN